MALRDYEGRPGSPLIGTLRVPVHTFYSITDSTNILPYTVDAEQPVTFFVVRGGDRLTIGKPSLLPQGALNALHIALLSPDAAVTFPALLGPVTPLRAPPTLNGAEQLQSTTETFPAAGDPSPDLLDSVADPAGPLPHFSREEVSSWSETKSDIPGMDSLITDYFYFNQNRLFGSSPRHLRRLPVVTVNVSTVAAGPPILEGLSRKCPSHKREAAELAFNRLLEAGMIETCTREDVDHVHAHVFVWKKDGTIRLTLDVSTLNSRLPRREVLMPDMRAFNEPLQGSSVFSDLDWRDFFFHFNYDAATSRLFGFVLPDGKTFGRYLAMVMGFQDSPGFAQALGNAAVIMPMRARFASQVISVNGVERPVHGISNYVDNSTLSSRMWPRPAHNTPAEFALAQQHFREAVVPFLELSVQLGLRFKPNNSRIAMRTSVSLGSITDGLKVWADPARSAGFGQMEPPKDIGIKYVHHVRGLFNWFLRFVVTRGSPLAKLEYQRDIQLFTNIIVDNTRTGQLAKTLWTEEHTAAFYRLRDALAHAAAAYVLDDTKSLYLLTDASNDGWAGTAFQYDDEGTPCPVLMMAFLWTAAQRGYGTKEQECFAVVEMMRCLRALRLPTQIIIRVDHDNLRYLYKAESPTLQRWFHELCSYGNVFFQHVPGTVNGMDFASRIASAMPATSGSPPSPRLIAAVTRSRALSPGPPAMRSQSRGQRSPSAAPASGPTTRARARSPMSLLPPPLQLSSTTPAAAPTVPSAAAEVLSPPVQLSAQKERAPLTAASTAPERNCPAYLSLLQRIHLEQTRHFSPDEINHMRATPRFKITSGAGGRPPLWTVNGKFVIPTDAVGLKREILEEGHEGALHGGEHDVISRTRHFYWLNKHDDVHRHVEACPVCQIKRAPPREGPAGAPHIVNSGFPFERVIVDHVPMPDSDEGYKAILTFTDAFTRWNEAITVADLSAAAALSALLLFKTRHGLPAELQVDNHGAFKADFADYCKANGVAIRETAAHHAAANGIGERPHKTIQDKLRAVCSPNGKIGRWAQALPFVMEAVNTAVNRSIGMSPFEALYGREARSTLDARTGRDVLNISLSNYQELITTVQRSVGLRDHLRASLQHDAHLSSRPTPPAFSTGDEVVLFYPTRVDKMHSYWRPGYVVVGSDSTDFYTIAKREPDGNLYDRQTVPVARLRPFNAARSPDGGVYLDIKRGHHVVDRIVSHVVYNGRYKFRVQWRGIGRDVGDTPASYANLYDLLRNCRPMMAAYCAKHNIKMYVLERQRAAERKEERGETDLADAD